MSVDSNLAFGLALRFAVTIDSQDLGNWSKVEGLDVTWDVAEHRVGDAGNFRFYFAAASKFSNVKLTRGVSADGAKKVMDWLGTVSFAADKNMTARIEMRDASNTAV